MKFLHTIFLKQDWDNTSPFAPSRGGQKKRAMPSWEQQELGCPPLGGGRGRIFLIEVS
jgi:hypothetical protein